MKEQKKKTTSGIPIKPLYQGKDLAPFAEDRDLGEPGSPPFTRGIYPAMYRSRPWTMRQYAGFGTAAETNARFRFLLDAGQTGLSVAFDLPTQMGYDSDSPRAEGEVGRVGVAIDSLEDMEVLLAEIPLGRVSTSMTINATAAVLLAYYLVVAEKQGVPAQELAGTIQNDILKEYLARGTYIYPPKPSLRLITDVFAFCRREVPRWNTISISGYHIREAGATAVQEIAFTLANALTYVEAARAAGLEVDEFAPRLSFFFNVHNHLFEEAAKLRAARRLWARLMEERFHPRNPRSLLLRFHCQTAGCTLQAHETPVNVARVTIQALAAVLGGTQSLHTNSSDEALSLPSEEAACVALRTQQVLAGESGMCDTVDPLGGSYYVESLTGEIEERVRGYLAEIERRGGVLACIESGYLKREIERSAYEYQKGIEEGAIKVAGWNYPPGVRPRTGPGSDKPARPPAFALRPEVEREQEEKLAALRKRRDQSAVEGALAELGEAARGEENVMPPILRAARAYATVGEISDVLRGVFGTYEPS